MMETQYTGVLKVEVVNFRTLEEVNKYLFGTRLIGKWEYRVIQIDKYQIENYENMPGATVISHEDWLRVWIELKERK